MYCMIWEANRRWISATYDMDWLVHSGVSYMLGDLYSLPSNLRVIAHLFKLHFTKSYDYYVFVKKDVEKNGKLLKQILNSKDQFTKSLYKLMKDQGTPISKVPSLGFKRGKLHLSLSLHWRALSGDDMFTLFNHKSILLVWRLSCYYLNDTRTDAGELHMLEEAVISGCKL